MTAKEGDEFIRELQQRREGALRGTAEEKFINDCFRVLDEHPTDEGKCRTALILCKIVRRGLKERVEEYLQEHPDLPNRAIQVLQANLMRMAGY